MRVPKALVDVDTRLLRDAMQCAYVCGTCLWNFISKRHPKHGRNTIKLFIKLLRWMGDLPNKDDNLERECVEYLEIYLFRAYKRRIPDAKNEGRLLQTWVAMPNIFDRLQDLRIEIFSFFVFLYNENVHMLDMWRKNVALLKDLLDSYEKMGLNCSRLLEVFVRAGLSPAQG